MYIIFIFRHPDKRNINRGICLKARPRACDAHTDCNGFGGKCCNGHCCNDKYFKEIMKIPCVTNEGCQVYREKHHVIKQN